MVMKVAVLLQSMVVFCIFTQTINANSTNGTSTSANNTTPPSSTKIISLTPSTSDLPNVTSTSRSQNISSTTVEIQTTSTTSLPSTTGPGTGKTISSTTTPKLTGSPSIDATPNVYSTTSFKMTETSHSTVGKTTASSSSDNRTATITSVATNGTLSSSSRSSTHGQTSSAATSFAGSPSTTAVMPTVIPNWTNWGIKGNCKDICCGIGGTITQTRACTKGSITLTSPNLCDGNSTKIVSCNEVCLQCSSGLMLMTERLVAVGCLVLGLVIKLLYAG